VRPRVTDRGFDFLSVPDDLGIGCKLLDTFLRVALRTGEAGSSDAANEAADIWPTAKYIKLSVRLMRPTAYRLGQDARAAG
jgi:hypothetical protein